MEQQKQITAGRITAWQASDGKTFMDRKEFKTHQADLDRVIGIASLMQKIIDRDSININRDAVGALAIGLSLARMGLIEIIRK